VTGGQLPGREGAAERERDGADVSMFERRDIHGCGATSAMRDLLAVMGRRSRRGITAVAMIRVVHLHLVTGMRLGFHVARFSRQRLNVHGQNQQCEHPFHTILNDFLPK